MSRAQKIVDEILSSERYAQMFENRVFSDEPILTTGRDVATRQREAKDRNAVRSHGDTGRTQTAASASSQMETFMAGANKGHAVASGPPTSPAQSVSGRQGSLFSDLFGSSWDLEPSGHTLERTTRAQPRGVQLPETLCKLRRLERGHTSWSFGVGGGSKLFFDQAKLAEAYTDDFEGNGAAMSINSPYPTYQLMSDYELRMYFTWRTRFRAGEAVPCIEAFRLVHAFELISGIGAEPGPAGLAELRRLASSFAGISATYDAQMRRWIHDYVIYWNLPKEELDVWGGALSQAEAVSVLALSQARLLEARANRPNGTVRIEWPANRTQREQMGLPDESTLLDALCALSRYRAEKSRFVKERRAEVAIVAARVFSDMVNHCALRRKVDYVEGLFGGPTRLSYTMFPQALFWTEERHEDSRFEVSISEAYSCERGFWWHVLPCRRLETNKEIGNLLHAIDTRLRLAVDYPHALKAREVPKYQGRFVDDEISWLMEERKRQEATRVRIDYSSLEAIRSSQVRIREALLTDEERSDDDVSLPGTPEIAPAEERHEETHMQIVPASGEMTGPEQTVEAQTNARMIPGLTQLQTEIVIALLEGNELPSTGASGYLSLEIDAINECFLDLVGDTVVEYVGDEPRLVEDYEQDVCEVLGL